MANTLGVYNPLFYANEALILLYKALGMATRVHLGFDEERRAFRLGDTIMIRKPSTFTAQNAPSSPQDMATETTSIVLSEWKEVKIKLTDKELAYTQERIINDHIEPAAYALADEIDLQLATLYADVPWQYALAAAPASTAVSDITGPRRVMFDNKVPLIPGRLHYMIDGGVEQGFLQLAAFSQWQGAADTGVSTQRRGTLGQKYGFEIFANQNAPTHTTGTASTTALLVNGAITKGATTIGLDAATVTGTLKKGDTFVIAGNTQRYAVTGDVTASANAFANVGISPPAVAAYADNTAATLSQQTAANTAHLQNIAFHRNAFALAFAPLSMMGNELGARIATVQDPITGLALRSRLYYEADISEVRVALDVLFGKKTLDPNLAVRGYRTLS